jgi:DNA-binding transcriptional MocR family regulator
LNRDQFAVVLSTLRSRVREGAWVEGEPLTVADIASECGVSATPVREALARLAGEGLVEDWRGRGYHARRIDVVDLADLYGGQYTLAKVGLAAAQRGVTHAAWEFHPSTNDFLLRPVATWEALFEGLARRANNKFLMTEQRRLADLLAPARHVEPSVLAEAAEDFEPLVGAIERLDWCELDAQLGPVIRRRKAALGDLVGAMRINSTKYKVSIQTL